MTRLPPCSAVHRPLARATFWSSVAALAWTQAGYGLFLALLRRARGGPGAAQGAPPAGDGALPSVALIVAAYAEEDVIADKVANALALDWPRDKLEVIVAVDGGAEPARTPPRPAPARPAPTWCWSCRAAARSARRTPAFAPRAGELLVFTDANAPGSPTRCAR